MAFYKLLVSSILFVLCDICQQVGTKHWDELQQFYGFLIGLCSFYNFLKKIQECPIFVLKMHFILENPLKFPSFSQRNIENWVGWNFRHLWIVDDSLLLISTNFFTFLTKITSISLQILSIVHYSFFGSIYY